MCSYIVRSALSSLQENYIGRMNVHPLHKPDPAVLKRKSIPVLAKYAAFMHFRKKHYHRITESEKPNERGSLYRFIPLPPFQENRTHAIPGPRISKRLIIGRSHHNQPKTVEKGGAHCIDFISKKIIHIRNNRILHIMKKTKLGVI